MPRRESHNPSSDDLIDLHISIVPQGCWIQRLNYASQDSIEETFSAGFIRIHPDRSINSLRKDLGEQIGANLFPSKYVFLKHVGRCLALVREKQECELKVKNFITPGNVFPELFILPSQPSTYNNLVLPPMTKSALYSNPNDNSLIHGESPSRSDCVSKKRSNCQLQASAKMTNNRQIIVDVSGERAQTRRSQNKASHCGNKAGDGINSAVSKSSSLHPASDGLYQHVTNDRTESLKVNRPSKDITKKYKTHDQLKKTGSKAFRRPQEGFSHPSREWQETVISSAEQQKPEGESAYLDKSPLPSRGTHGEYFPTVSKSKESQLFLSDLGPSDDFQDQRILKQDASEKQDNDVSDHNSNLSREDPLNLMSPSFRQRKVSIEEPPILIPKFVRSPVPLEGKVKCRKATTLNKSGNSEASHLQTTVRRQRKETPYPEIARKRLWQELQRVQASRGRPDKPNKNFSHKRKVQNANLSQAMIFKKNPAKVPNPKRIYQADQNNSGEKCHLCYYIFHTEADRKRHFGLVHGGRMVKLDPGRDTQMRLTNGIMTASDETVHSSQHRKRADKKVAVAAGGRGLMPIKQ